jgi:hypothetical protein
MKARMKGGPRKQITGLQVMVKAVEAGFWPTPQSFDAKAKDNWQPGSEWDRTQKIHTLSKAVQIFPTPTVNDSKNNNAPSQLTKGQGGRNLNVVIGGSLNPTWVEWLMGFPLGWTDLEHSETL